MKPKVEKMAIVTENAATIAILLIALAILGWGYYRAKPFGKLGVLAWLQSVSLMVPWLIFFGLFAFGVYLNLVSILFLLVGSAGLYIYLGNKLRTSSQDTALREKLEALLKSEATPAVSEPQLEAKTDNSTETKQIPPIPEGEVLPIPGQDLQTIKEIFGIDTFFATETISYQDGAIFKGNLRGEPALVQSRLSEKLTARLGERYRIFLVQNPENKPMVIVLPSSNDPQPATLQQRILSIVLILATLATTLETGGLVRNFDYFKNFSRSAEVWPFAAGIWAILIAHELGHQVMAKRYKVRFSWPYFLPALQLGSFGAFNRFESLLPNRKALFDIAFAGPAAGGLISLAMLIVGLLLSHPGSLFEIPAEFFKGSLLVGTLAKVVLGDALQQPLVDVHPLSVLGWLGLVVTALNLMPAGQLDGGRIIQAIYGRKVAGRTTVATLIVLSLVALLNPLSLYWAIVILFLQRNLERPAQDDITEPDDARAALGLLALFLMLATLIPLSPGLAGRLGIGS